MVHMNTNAIEIKIVDSWPEEDIVALYKAGGWWKETYDTTCIPAMMRGSFAFAVAIEKQTNRAVGMGRLLSDGVSDAYIQDLVVLSPHRNKGIGRRLVSTLLEHGKQHGLVWIGLIAEPGQEPFYTPLHFKRMKQYVPMKYENNHADS